jgi:hypothetical protein
MRFFFIKFEIRKYYWNLQEKRNPPIIHIVWTFSFQILYYSSVVHNNVLILYIYHFSILRFHVVNLIILFIARLMTISAPMATINMRSRTTDYTAMARVAQKWLQLKKYWYYRFQSYCIRFQIKFRIRWSTLIISDKPFFPCPECTLYVLSGV